MLEKSVRTGSFTLASGKQSDLYIDCRVTALDPFGANLIGDLGWHAVRSKIVISSWEQTARIPVKQFYEIFNHCTVHIIKFKRKLLSGIALH